LAIKPIDVRRKEFKNSLRGYDQNQVDDFLDSVADEFERTYAENGRMREEISGLRERLQQFSDLEGSIRAALVHAEQAAKDLRESANREAETVRESARREAELTINEAKARSHQLLADSSARVERVQESYEALRQAKQSFADDFRRLLKSYADVMENIDVSSAREIESSLRNRLDTESVAVAREAAAHAPQQPSLPDAAPQETAAEPTSSEPASAEVNDEETRAFTPEDMAAAQGLSTPPRAAPDEPFEESSAETSDEPSPSAGPSDVQSGVQTREPFEWREEDEQDTGPLAPAAEERAAEHEAAREEPEAPETTEPEIEPSTVPEDEREQEPVASSPGNGEDDTQEHGSSASQQQDDDARYDAFFDRDTEPQQRESRVSRASRFLRRRG
jgi:cell division initiation protein